MRCLLILCSLALVGCRHATRLEGSGEVAPPPAGWDEHCKIIPKPDECGK